MTLSDADASLCKFFHSLRSPRSRCRIEKLEHPLVGDVAGQPFRFGQSPNEVLLLSAVCVVPPQESEASILIGVCTPTRGLQLLDRIGAKELHHLTLRKVACEPLRVRQTAHQCSFAQAIGTETMHVADAIVITRVRR